MSQVAVPVEAQAPSAPLQKVKAGKNKNGIRPTEILKQLNASKDDNRKLKLEIASLEARLNVYEVQADDDMQLAVYRVVELQILSDDLKAQNDDLKAQNDTYIVRINAMQTEIAQLQTHQLVAENQQLANQNEQLGIIIEEHQGKINYLEYQAEELRDNMKNLDEELDEANETGYTLQERVNVLTREHTCLQAQVTYLEGQLDLVDTHPSALIGLSEGELRVMRDYLTLKMAAVELALADAPVNPPVYVYDTTCTFCASTVRPPRAECGCRMLRVCGVCYDRPAPYPQVSSQVCTVCTEGVRVVPGTLYTRM